MNNNLITSMKCTYIIIVIFLPFLTSAQNLSANVFYNKNLTISKNILIAEDKTNKLNSTEALTTLAFVKNNQNVVNLGVSSSTHWLMFSVLNKSNDSHLLLDISNPDIDILTLYTLGSLKKNDNQQLGNIYPYEKRKFNNQDFLFDVNIPANQTQTFLLQVKSSTQLLVPIQIGNPQFFLEYLPNKDLIFGIFFGIVCAMFFYNLFIYFTIKDPIYIYYVCYIFITTVSQCTLQGYSNKYLWPHSTWLMQNGIFIFTNLGGIAAILFTKKFLHAKQYAPKLNYIFDLALCFFVLSILLMLLGKKQLSFGIMQITTIIGSLIAILIGIVTLRAGVSSAKFFLFAWLSLLVGATIFVLKDYEILPINVFTSNTLEFGFALEVILLSFALADKINTYKKEKDASQAEALRMLKENEQLVQEQNIVLEKKITERTHVLEQTLQELKDAQIQLVESEKMASLGQLTAGIAHEINNPINFVKSNVSPLQMDFKDLFELIHEYQKLHDVNIDEHAIKLQQIRNLENRLDPDFLKEEIENLIGGIEEGAERTAEIVRGLRNFSRLDESEVKEINIYENINSTLILLRNTTPHYLTIRKHFHARSEIECYPGKLNQVFMNILTNCIQAIKMKEVKNTDEYIDIYTEEVNDHMKITITDSGIGMSEEVKHKIFEPFFTTKDVGEGTGLGMAIVFKIIEKHHGKISVASSPGEGASFVIDIPYMLKSVSALAG